MLKRKSSIRRMLVTNAGIAAVIVFVFLAAFIPADMPQPGPVMKGQTHGSNVALQIAVDDNSDLSAYMDALDTLGVKATFFFSERVAGEDNKAVDDVVSRGNGAGYYTGEGGQTLTMYIGAGLSIPVMNCFKAGESRQVCPSIDVTKLKILGDWQRVLGEKLADDMFIYIKADNNIDDFKKTVQIVLNKGYTILKMDEML